MPVSPITKAERPPRPAMSDAVAIADVTISSESAVTPMELRCSTTSSGVRLELLVTNARPLPIPRSRSTASGAPPTGCSPRYRTPSRSNTKESYRSASEGTWSAGESSQGPLVVVHPRTHGHGQLEMGHGAGSLARSLAGQCETEVRVVVHGVERHGLGELASGSGHPARRV